MFAAVDLGSNSFRLHIARLQGQSMNIVRTARVPVRLGEGLDEQGCLTPQAMQAGLEALSRFSRILSRYPLQGVRVVGTQALRRARNASEFLSHAEQVMAYPIEIISGEEEGRLIYLGIAHGSQDDISPRLGVCAADGFLKSHSLYSVHVGHVWRGTEPKDDRKAANQVEMCASQCRIYCLFQ